MADLEKETSPKQEHDSSSASLPDYGSNVDLLSFHEQNAGRLIIDPAYVPPLLESSHTI